MREIRVDELLPGQNNVVRAANVRVANKNP